MNDYIKDLDILPNILKTSEVAQILRISPRMVQILAKEGKIPSIQLAHIRGYRFKKEDIFNFIETNTHSGFIQET